MMLQSDKKSNLLKRILVCLGIFLIFGINACKSSQTELQFQTVAQEQFTDSAKMYELKEPQLIIFSSIDDVNALKGFINDDAKEYLRTLDYSKSFAILVLQGFKPGMCYGVNITEITRLQDNVTVYADFTEARPDMGCPAMVVSPYHLVQVDKTGSWDQDITFDLVVNQVMVVSVSHFVP